MAGAYRYQRGAAELPLDGGKRDVGCQSELHWNRNNTRKLRSDNSALSRAITGGAFDERALSCSDVLLDGLLQH